METVANNVGWYSVGSLSNKPMDPQGNKVRVYHVGRTVLYNECLSLEEAQNHARIGCIFNGVGAAYVYSSWGNKWYRITWFMASHGRSSSNVVDWLAEDLPTVVKTMEMVG